MGCLPRQGASDADRCRHGPPVSTLARWLRYSASALPSVDGVGALGGVLGRRPDRLGRRRLADQRLLDAAGPHRGRAMLVSPTRASAIVPPSTATVAATATIDQACATRLNFS